MKKLEKYFFLIAILFIVKSMAFANGEIVAEVPMKFRGVMPAVEVLVNGEGPFLFAIDTGGQGQARADTTLVEKLKLKKVGEVQAGDGSGKNTRTLDLVGMDSIKIGDLEFKDVRALTRNYNRSPRVPPIDGILGFNLFEDYLLTLDYVNKKVLITKGELPKANGKDILNFAGSEAIPSLELTVGKQKIKAHIDSGNMVGAFVLPTEMVEKVSLIGEPKIVGRARTISNVIEIKQAQLKDSISFGQFEFKQPKVVYPALREANIGSHLLKEFSITFDQKNKRLKLQKAVSSAETQDTKNVLDTENLIAQMIKLIDEKFVDIPAGKKVINGLTQNLKSGKYKNLGTDAEFRQVINKDLYELSRDLHLSVRPLNPNSTQMRQGGNGQRVRRGTPNGSSQMRRMGNPRTSGRTINRPADGHFVGKILDGNIGYVKVNGALYPTQGSQVKQDMENALQTVKNADAVIFDLRNVPGGVPDTISLLSSYLYDEKPKLLNTYYHRTRGARELKTDPKKVPFHFGERLPAYVLINSRTASGGEAFTYLNQQHGRVTVVGETSRGAGRLSAAYPISQTLMLMVPENRSEHPVSKTGFEKVGVKPNIEAKSEDSLYVAHKTALQNILGMFEASNKKKDSSKWKSALAKISEDKKNLDAKLKDYEGVYGIRTIVISGKNLLYRKEGQIELSLKQISKDTYKLVLPANARSNGALPDIRFDRDSNGRVISFSLIKADGTVQDTFKKKN